MTELITQSYKKREAAEVRVKASSPMIDVELEDGARRQFVVPDFAQEMIFVGQHSGKSINVSLSDVRPQSLVVRVPDFEVNGEPLKAGAVRFLYRQTTRSVC